MEEVLVPLVFQAEQVLSYNNSNSLWIKTCAKSTSQSQLYIWASNLFAKNVSLSTQRRCRRSQKRQEVRVSKNRRSKVRRISKWLLLKCSVYPSLVRAIFTHPRKHSSISIFSKWMTLMAISGTCTMRYRRELRIVLITWRIYPSSCAKYLLNVNKISSEIRKTSSPKLMRSSTNNKLHSAKIMSKKFHNSISVSAKSTINYRLLQTTPIKWIMTSC